MPLCCGGGKSGPSARLVRLLRTTWNLHETLYWYARRTHVGYEGEKTLTRDETAAALDNLGQDLRTVALHARASLRANVPGALADHLEVAERNTRFWQTFSMGEVGGHGVRRWPLFRGRFLPAST